MLGQNQSMQEVKKTTLRIVSTLAVAGAVPMLGLGFKVVPTAVDMF